MQNIFQKLQLGKIQTKKVKLVKVVPFVSGTLLDPFAKYKRPHLYIRLTSTSFVNPIPPQYCRHESVTSRASRPAFNLHIEASLVTSSP